MTEYPSMPVTEYPSTTIVPRILLVTIENPRSSTPTLLFQRTNPFAVMRSPWGIDIYAIYDDVSPRLRSRIENLLKPLTFTIATDWHEFWFAPPAISNVISHLTKSWE